MKTSIIIPVYNEEKTVGEIVEKVKCLGLDKEVIVVDDGSTDKSFEKVSKIKGIKLLRHEKNKGKGAAVRTGLMNSTGDIILIQDADLELDPKQIPNLIKPIIDGTTKVVYGSRNINNPDKQRTILFYLGGHLVTLVTNLLYGVNLTDEPCGYKVFKREIFNKIKIDSNRFEWEPEITAKVSKLGLKIYEVPVVSKSRTVKEGKKLNKMDGIKALLTLIKYRFKT